MFDSVYTTATITRGKLREAIRVSLNNTRDLTVDEREALKQVAETAETVSIGSFRLLDEARGGFCGCPLTQAFAPDIADDLETWVPAYGSERDKAFNTFWNYFDSQFPEHATADPVLATVVED